MKNGLYNSYNLEFSRQYYSDNVVCQAATFSFWSDNPVPKYKVGDAVPFNKLLSPEVISNYSDSQASASELGTYFVITKIKITDEVIGERNGFPFRQWQFTFDGFIREDEDSDNQVIVSKYSTTAEVMDSGYTLFKATLETICFGDNPLFLYDIGDTFSIPGIPVSLTCTNYSFSDSFNDINHHVWTVTYEGSTTQSQSGEQPDTPVDDNDEDISFAYEINGGTVRTVDGEFIVLKRSETPIRKTTITFYSNSKDLASTIGSSYKDYGIAVSETITKEAVKVNGVAVGSQFKHTIEVEA